MTAMRRRYSIPTYRTVRRIATAVVALCLAACASDDPTATSDDGGGNGGGAGTEGRKVNIVIAASQTETRAIDENTGNEIRSVRIYAYPHGETNPIGYLYDNSPELNKGTYQMALSNQFGQVDFIALLNDGGAEAANGTPEITLNENTTLENLNAYRIGRKLQEYGTAGSGGYAIPMSTLEGTNGANRTFTLTETSAPQYINLTATRAMGRLRLYFAKCNTGNATVQITSATLTQGPLSTRLMTEESVESLPIETWYDTAGTNEITVVDSPVKVEKEATPDTKLTTENTTLVATAYIPENPRGATLTHGDGLYEGEYDGNTNVYTQSAYKLTLSYEVGSSTVENKVIYLPAVKRNQTVNVFGLLQGEEVRLYVRMDDWDVKDVDLKDYPTYSDCGLAENRSGYTTEAGYVAVGNPITYDEREKQLKAAFACTFNMTAPGGHEFVPKLTGAGEARFKLYIESAAHNEVSQCTAGQGVYTIYVIPTEEYDEDKPNTVDLLITTHTWAGPVDPLLINLNRNWNAGDNPQDDRIRITLKKPEATTTP